MKTIIKKNVLHYKLYLENQVYTIETAAKYLRD
jgi:hypothetical protein